MECTDNLNIVRFKPLLSPSELKKKLPQTNDLAHFVAQSRRTIQDILTNKDHRRMVIVGPCSLHDSKATLEYTQRLKGLQDELSDNLFLIMRAYFEKPRTTLGWKGMIYDPYLDNSYDIENGLTKARELLIEITKIGMAAATEFLDPIVPQYLADMISWASIGARTTESQVHRQMASGLSMPIGFKNSTDGNLARVIQAIKTAANSHSFLGIDRDGRVIVAETRGNTYGHLVMRGGSSGPNFSSEHVAFAEILLQKSGILNNIVIDCSHANSHKDHHRQREALLDIAGQLRNGNRKIAGVMLESFLHEGNQPVASPDKLIYGVSLTDNCIGWEETAELIRDFAQAND